MPGAAAECERTKTFSPSAAGQLWGGGGRIRDFPNVASIRERDIRSRCFPLDESAAPSILKSLRPGIQRGGILVAPAKSIPEGERIEAMPTACVPKRGRAER